MKYLQSRSTGKIGINYVRNIFELNNNIFNEIHQENDVGIDAIIEFVENEVTTGNCIALQIKSGPSFFRKKTNECIIPVDGHVNYWKNHILPVFGIVFVPKLNNAYWINIKNYINDQKKEEIEQLEEIRFSINRLNVFDSLNYNKYFLPRINHRLPQISFDEAKELFNSGNYTEKYVGMVTLANKYSHINETWGILINYFRLKENLPFRHIPSELVLYLAYIPRHPDINGDIGNFISSPARDYAKCLINEFTEKDVIKLLTFVDSDNFISRGSLGQCIEAIISLVSDKENILKSIIENNTLPTLIRESAAAIFLYNYQENGYRYLKNIMKLAENKNLLTIPQLLDMMENFMGFNPYSFEPMDEQ